MTDYEYLKTATDEQLDRWKRERWVEQDKLKRHTDRIQQDVDAIRSEQTRRELDAYWEARPELIRLKPNDQLLNDEVAGYPTEFIEVDIETSLCSVRWYVFYRNLNPQYWVYVPMERVQAMRRAYLESEAALKALDT